MFDEKKADTAFRQDRERFFAAADKYDSVEFLKKSLTEEQKEELEKSRQAWRDMTADREYPDINFPLYIPDFLKVKIFSTHEKKGAV